MKRPPGLWLLLSAGVLWMSLQSVYGLRATELIFGKSTTTTTTTEAISKEQSAKDGVSESATEAAESTTIKSNLTGNPQLDYIYDPNLPRELNGYNLSAYPFYNSMPEDIDFKCDGLHDGFYASVPHKCQLYHHCLFGTRFDFLCANYTAFDQKTFICHFVSEVDCVNSRKYWFRNDVLYEAASTTTLKPLPLVISPAITAARRPLPSIRQPRPSRRRPQYDDYDEEYADDDREEYYEEPRPRPRRRKRPRPRPRPIYEDDYEEYEDERYERRPGRPKDDDDRKPYDRRESYDRHGSGREPDDRRSSESERKAHDRKEPDDGHNRKPYDRRESEDRRTGDNDRKPYDRRQSDDKRVSDNDKKHDGREPDDRRDTDDDKKSNDKKEGDDRRSSSDGRKPYDRREHDGRRSPDSERKSYDRREYDDRRYEDRPSDNKRYKDDRRHDYEDRPRYDRDEEFDYRYDRDRRRDEDRKRRPADDERYERDDRRSPQEKRRYENRRPLDDTRPHDRPRKGHRRPHDDDVYDDEKEDDRRYHDRPRKNDKNDNPSTQDSKQSPSSDDKPLVKPNGTSFVFNQPRLPPRIKLPVLKNEQNKFAHKPPAEKPVTKKTEDDEEYYEEDYEEEPPPKRSSPRPSPKPEPEVSETRRPNKSGGNSEREEKRETRRPLGQASKPRVQMFRRPVVDPFDDYEDEKPKQPRPHTTRSRHDVDNRDDKTNSNNKNRPTTEDYSDINKDDEKTTKRPSKERNTNQSPPKFIPKDPRVRTEYKEYRDEPKLETTSSTTTTTTSTTTTTTTKEPPRERPEPIVRVVKRPFLPSRGGNPYSSRGLQPVGAKALDNTRSPPPPQKEIDTPSTPENEDIPEIEEPVMNARRPFSTYQPETLKPISEDYDEPKESYKPNIVPLRASEEEEVNTYRNTETEESETIPNGRQPLQEHKSNSFLINEQPVDNYKHGPSLGNSPQKDSYETSFKATQPKEPEPEQDKPTFKPSPALIKVPIRLKYSNPIGTEDEEEFKPVSNRPQTALRGNVKHKTYQDPRTTEKANIPERNPLDITENEYDVTLNDALNPTIPNLPVRNFPSGFGAATDYTFSHFHRPRYDVTLNQATENRYQVRAPSQRVETIVQPYINGGGKKYVNSNAQYNIPAEQIYQNQNFRSSPQITQAQTHAFYPVY